MPYNTYTNNYTKIKKPGNFRLFIGFYKLCLTENINYPPNSSPPSLKLR